MRLIVCTKRDLAGALVLNEMLPRLSGHDVMVLLSDKTRPVENAVPELTDMKFFERDLPIDTLFPLVDQIGDNAARLATFDGLAARHGAAIKVVYDINGPDSEKLVRDYAPDLIISVRFSLIFKRNIFEIPKFGTYNIHPGALPRYAGLFAPFRCMIEGGRRIGCTLHRVDDGIDTGPIVGIGWLPIEPAKSLLWHVLNTYKPGLDLFFDTLHAIERGRPVAAEPQDRSQRVYASLPDAASFRTFRDKGLRLFDAMEYRQIIADFLPPGMDIPHEVSIGISGQKVGASCCCAHA